MERLVCSKHFNYHMEKSNNEELCFTKKLKFGLIMRIH